MKGSLYLIWVSEISLQLTLIKLFILFGHHLRLMPSIFSKLALSFKDSIKIFAYKENAVCLIELT